jgi:uncharacterized protein YfiM (DUF2279 family)|tara:strand:+ start:756 stop:1172 length:417 start_codon:yes stop_codon:yes gene_type:complete
MKLFYILLCSSALGFGQYFHDFSFDEFIQQDDKKLHFLAGNITGATGYIISYKKYNNKKRALITGICTAFTAGVAKELYDSAIVGGKIDPEDILATTLGGITINLTIPLFQKKKTRYRQLDKKIGGYYYPHKQQPKKD